MAEKYIRVYVKDITKDMVEITPEFLYLTIPKKYICTYHRLLVAISDFGKELIEHCNNPCKDNNKIVLSCWNLFQCALAAHCLGNYKQADLYIDYVNKQLSHYYESTNLNLYNGGEYYSLEDGYLTALCSCVGDVVFEVNLETGELYQTFKDDVDNTEKFYIENSELFVTNLSKI